LKLLHVISSINPNGGGPIEGIRQLRRSLQPLGVEVEIASCDSPDAPWIATSDLPRVHPLGPSHLGYGYTPRLVPWLRNNAQRFDAVVVNGLWQYHSIAVRQALASTKIPYFVFTHGMLDPWFKKAYPLKHLKKWLYWPWAEYRVLRDARAVIFTCEEERLLASQSFWLYCANEAVTTYGTSNPPDNGVELGQRYLAENPQLEGKRIVLFLSRIHEKKGCDLLLDAFAEVASKDDRLHLIIAGPDQSGWTAALQARAERLGIAESVSWPGMLQGDAKWGAFYAADAFCLPSHQENFGIVVAEALACGKPVLITNKVNIWREIDADNAGFVDEDTKEGALRNLQRFLALDSREYTAMCQRAKNCFNERFHINQAGRRLIEIVRENAACTL
jgi:glycosyltransferase involved in cell wall biosynthesis